ncbi:MAG: RrF2 family transcriptional regulator [Desulfovibrionaceae bacterium]
MKLTTRSRYGARMVLDIAIHGAQGPVRIPDIAARQGLSVKYLEKLIRELKTAGCIKSRRGPKGGHMLAKPAEEITLGEIVRALEGDLHLIECGKDGVTCPRAEHCQTRTVWLEAGQALFDKLDSLSLADLMQRGEFCPAPHK